MAAPSYAEVVKPRTEKASSGRSFGSKESRENRQNAGQGERSKTVKDAVVEEEENSSDEDVWATEDEEYYGNESDSSQEEGYVGRLVSLPCEYETL